MSFKTEEQHYLEIATIRQSLSAKSPLALAPSKSPSHTMRGKDYKKGAKTIDFSSLNQILTIDPEKKMAWVEPKMTVRALCKETLKYGLIPPVVPEFPDITVGGAIMGAAIESSSHHYGQFSDSCLEYELLLADGTLLIVSPEKDPDLFYGVSGSYGSLAFLTCVKLRLTSAKPFVRVTYVPLKNSQELISFFQKNSSSHFLDGVMLSSSQAVGMKGILQTRSPSLLLIRLMALVQNSLLPIY